MPLQHSQEHEQHQHDSLVTVSIKSDERPSSSISTSSSYGSKKVLKVLHLTDAHYDPEYVVGSNAVCEAPLCCNRDSGKLAIFIVSLYFLEMLN